MSVDTLSYEINAERPRKGREVAEMVRVNLRVSSKLVGKVIKLTSLQGDRKQHQCNCACNGEGKFGNFTTEGLEHGLVHVANKMTRQGWSPVSAHDSTFDLQEMRGVKK